MEKFEEQQLHIQAITCILTVNSTHMVAFVQAPLLKKSD